MFRRHPPPDAPALAILCAAAAAGALGLLPGAAGAFDPVAVLGWLALIAPAAGALVGRAGVGLFPFALAVPGGWGLVLALAQARAVRGLPSPLWALCALAGLFALGLALGRRSRAALGGAAGLLLATLALATLATGFGLLAGGDGLARARPSAAARLLELSPLVLVFDCAGWDWTHAQPEVYARAGVEWFQRRSFPGSLAGPAVLVVGCALALLVRPPARAP